MIMISGRSVGLQNVNDFTIDTVTVGQLSLVETGVSPATHKFNKYQKVSLFNLNLPDFDESPISALAHKVCLAQEPSNINTPSLPPDSYEINIA